MNEKQLARINGAESSSLRNRGNMEILISHPASCMQNIPLRIWLVAEIEIVNPHPTYSMMSFEKRRVAEGDLWGIEFTEGRFRILHPVERRVAEGGFYQETQLVSRSLGQLWSFRPSPIQQSNPHNALKEKIHICIQLQLYSGSNSSIQHIRHIHHISLSKCKCRA